MNTKLFKEKLTFIKKEGSFPDLLMEKTAHWLRNSEDWELFRINPVALAGTLGLEETPLVDFFVHGARAGLFDFSWSMICPSCGEIQNNDSSFNALEGGFRCVVCQVPVTVNIDDAVEVTFSFNPSVRTLRLDPFRDAEAYRKGFFSAAVQRSPQMLRFMGTIWEGFETVPAQETLILDRSWTRSRSYRFVSAGIHRQFLFHVHPDAGEDPEDYELTYTEAGVSPQELTVHSLNARFRIQNRLNAPVGLMMVQADFPKLHQVMRQHPSRLGPMLTGNRLLNNQAFRHLFKLQNLSPTLRLNIRSLTLLFTDLKGSTELYARTGDVDAYKLIQEHFQLLGGIVARHAGAVIKTMGDAVMASFSSPLDAVRAALDMLEENKRLKAGEESLGLKIGLHEGPALAINNQGSLDYFGQTVNIAARVQGLAGENTLWMTEPVLKSQGVAGHLKKKHFRARRYVASLKGVGEQTTVYELAEKEAG